MHRSLSALGALSLSLAALVAPAAAGAQARVAEQKIVGPPAPEAVLAGEPAAPAPTNKKMLSPMESALQTAAKDLRVASRKGMLVHPTSGARISQGASEAVLSVMSKPTGEAEAQVRNALMMSGNSRSEVDHLMSELPEVVSDPSTGRVRSAQKAFEEFMQSANESFRVNPPAEAMALDATLARMNSAVAGVRDDERARKEEQKAKKSQPKNDKKAAAEAKKRAAEEKKAADREKKAADKRAAEEKKAAEKRAADEKKAAEKAAKDKAKSGSK